MSQQGWPRNPRSGKQDDWWSQLYDPGSPDTGRTHSGDTLDDRYASVRRTVGQGTATGRSGPAASGTSGSGGTSGARGHGRSGRTPEAGGAPAEPDGDAEAAKYAVPDEDAPDAENGALTEGDDDARDADTGRETEPPDAPDADAPDGDAARTAGDGRTAGPGRAEASGTAETPGREEPPERYAGPRRPAREPYTGSRTDSRTGRGDVPGRPDAGPRFSGPPSRKPVDRTPSDPPSADPTDRPSDRSSAGSPARPPGGDAPAPPSHFASEPPARPLPDAEAAAPVTDAAEALPDARPSGTGPSGAETSTTGTPGEQTVGAGREEGARGPEQSGVPAGPEESGVPGGRGHVPRRPEHVGARPPTYEAEPAAFPAADASSLSELVPDTVLDGARYGGTTLRAASLRGDSARHRGALRRDALLTARFGSGESALLFVAVAAGGRAASGGHRAAREICHSMGSAVGRSHDRLAEDVRAGRRGALKSGLQRLTERCYGKLRAQAAALGMQPEEYTADLRCLLLSADPRCRTRVFFGSGEGGLFRLRSGAWQDAELAPDEPESGGAHGVQGRAQQPGGGQGGTPADEPGTDPTGQLGYGTDALDPSELGDPAALSVPVGSTGTSGPRAGLSDRDRRRPPQSGPQPDSPVDDGNAVSGGPAAAGGLAALAPDAGPPLPPVPSPVRPEPHRFRFCAVTARRGDTLLLCSPGLARPLRAEPALAVRLARSWSLTQDRPEPPGLAAYLADVQLRVRGYADDRTAVALWET